MPAKIINNKMEIAIHPEENIETVDTWCSVRGSERTIPMIVAITENSAEHIEWSESVLRICVHVRIWNPIKMTLLMISINAEKMNAVRLCPKA